MSNIDVAKKLSEVTHSKVSISEALKELELSKEAFAHADQISTQLRGHEFQLQELKHTAGFFVTFSFLNSKLEELSASLDKTLKSRMEELSISMLSQLNSKITLADAETLINKKVSWPQFSELNQQVGMMKTRMDKHILSEFEGLKTKVKLELASKSEVKKNVDMSGSDEVSQLKTRIVNLEQQIQQIFEGEENLDEDYDSQEELDNMMDDLERAVLKDRKSHELTEAFELKKAEAKETNENSALVIDIEEPANAEFSPDSGAQKMEVAGTKSLEVKPQENEPRRSLGDNKASIHVDESQPSPRNRLQSRGSESRSLIRKNSKESSAASRVMGGGSAAIKLMNKKLTSLQKELEESKVNFQDFKCETLKFNDDILHLEELIGLNNEKFKDLNERLEVMQASFLRALRRSGPTKEKPMPVEKKKKPQTNSRELDELAKDLEAKFKRLVRLETDNAKLASDFQAIKTYFKEKIGDNSAQQASIVEKTVQVIKEIEGVKKKCQDVEGIVNDKLTEMYKEVERLKGPLMSIVSDQNRESCALREEVWRNQEVFRGFLEEYSSKPKVNKTNVIYGEERGISSRIHSATPSLSVKHRYYKTNKASDSINPEENWLSYMPDGKPVWLPRVAKSAQRTERKVCTPDVDIKKSNL